MQTKNNILKNIIKNKIKLIIIFLLLFSFILFAYYKYRVRQIIAQEQLIYAKRVLYEKELAKELERQRIEAARPKTDVELGIIENLGTGYSDFSVSDFARNFNIRAALTKIDGLRIAPGETFSLLEHLSPFTKQNGYVKGLVIQGNEILPEIGGGMCQISTTLFRAAMNSGLEIVERTNHSLWLHWYDDQRSHTPGTDATIYDTNGGKDTDFKFLNNTQDYIKIHIRVDKAGHLNIDLIGTKDGRKGMIYEPKILEELSVASTTASTTNLTSSKLTPGKTFCNGPFKGAKAVFTYGITDKDGNETLKKFYSYYKPQERICNMGI